MNSELTYPAARATVVAAAWSLKIWLVMAVTGSTLEAGAAGRLAPRKVVHRKVVTPYPTRLNIA